MSSGGLCVDPPLVLIQVAPVMAYSGDSIDRGFVSATLSADGKFQLTNDEAQALKVRSVLRLLFACFSLTSSSIHVLDVTRTDVLHAYLWCTTIPFAFI